MIQMIKTLNIIGLCLDIIGASVMFLYTPHPVNVSGIGDGDDIANELKAAEYQKKRVKIGMTFLIAGFVFQLVSTILSP